MQPKVSIGIVLYGEKYLSESLPSLLKQDYENVEFLFIDQEENTWRASSFIREQLPDIANDPRVTITQGKNLWHSGGQNALIRQALQNGTEYYICASNDMLYPSDFISEVISELEKPDNQQFGSATVKLRQWRFSHHEKTEALDSCGISITPYHRFFDRGQGTQDRGQFDQQAEIFGASGALTIFRKKALQDAETDGQYYDERLHYKNDVDLAYRLQWLGWKSLYIPHITIWHDRQLTRSSNAFNFFRDRIEQKNWLKENSTFGQHVLIAKNFSSDFSWSVKFKTKLRMLALKIFALLFEPSSWKGIRKFKSIEQDIKQSSRNVPAVLVQKKMLPKGRAEMWV